MNEKYKATLKSAETEDWLDYHVIRPFCYYLSCLFARLDIHPNTVTIASMFFGAGSAYFFAHGMTGKKSRMGRILDGAAGFIWFFPIYSALVYRFYLHHDIEFGWLGLSDTPTNALIATGVVFLLGLISGIKGLAGQQRLADYYIQVHLFFLKGEKGSELDNSKRQREIYAGMTSDTPLVERLFQKSYIDYTLNQEKVTPQFQRLMKKIIEKYGSADKMPQSLRDDFRSQSLPLMKWNGLLTFNFRSFWLFLCI